MRVVRTASPAPSVVLDDVSAPIVSLVTVTYGTGPVVIEMLRTAIATTRSIALEAIVVDNPHPNTGDRTLAELALWTRGVRVVQPDTNLGFGGGCNLGAELAGGALIAFVNPDLVLSGAWLEPLIELLAADPTVAIAAPVLLDAHGGVQECGQRLFSDGTTFPIRRRPPHDQPITVDYASAACWVVRADDFGRLGGFDPAFYPAYFEDVDYVLRARRSGGRCVVHQAVPVTHHGGGGTPDPPRPAHAQHHLLLEKWPELWRDFPLPSSG